MKKLKKMTRKGLDALANEMPQVNEIQQRECVGGATFFDQYGNYLGLYGLTDDIQIIDPAFVSHTASGVALNQFYNNQTRLGVISHYVGLDSTDKTRFSGISLQEGFYTVSTNTASGIIDVYLANYVMNDDEPISAMLLEFDIHEALVSISEGI